jgi:hypothetical protein
VTEPSSEKLAQALEAEGAPGWMITLAREDHYHDFKSPLATPEMQLLADARENGLTVIAEGVMEGIWDATKEESDAWARSPEGQATFQELLGHRPNRAERRRKK